MEDIQKPFSPGEDVWVERPSGGYARAKISEAGVQRPDVLVSYRKPDGTIGTASVDYRTLSRTEPTAEMRAAAKARAAQRAEDEAVAAARAKAQKEEAERLRNPVRQRQTTDAQNAVRNYKPEWEKVQTWREYQANVRETDTAVRRLYDINAEVHSARGVTAAQKAEAITLYRKLNKALHPDKFSKDIPEDAYKFINDRFQEMKQQVDDIKKAYERP